MARNYEIKMLGTSDAWSKRRSSHQPSVLYWRLPDFYIIMLLTLWRIIPMHSNRINCTIWMFIFYIVFCQNYGVLTLPDGIEMVKCFSIACGCLSTFFSYQLLPRKRKWSSYMISHEKIDKQTLPRRSPTLSDNYCQELKIQIP